MGLACRLLRVLGVCTALLSPSIFLGMIGEDGKLALIFPVVMTVFLLGVIFFFSILIHKAGGRGEE